MTDSSSVGMTHTLMGLEGVSISKKGVSVQITAVLEPGRLREPRDAHEALFVLSDRELQALFPAELPRIVITHTRPEIITGILRRIDGGPSRFQALGYRNHGGTLDVNGMLYANGCSWAHLVQAAAQMLGRARQTWLTQEECAALDGFDSPAALFRENGQFMD